MSSPKLLIVDDSRLIVQIIADYFEPMGYEVLCAGDAGMAMRCLETETPDVIVSDVLMPEVDGWQMFEMIRSIPALADIPFIFLTTERELPQKLRGFHLGADDYVVKPFDVEELYARVERILERGRQLERARRGDGATLAGTVDHLSLPDLLQILSMNGRDGVVYLQEGEEEGEVHFENGNVVHAWAGPVAGTKALYRLLTWKTAAFRVMPRDGISQIKSVNRQISAVVMDGMVSVDEWNRWKDLLPDLANVLRVNGEKRATLSADNVSESEFEVLSRSRTGSSVGRILDDSPLLDGALAGAICSLLEREILLPGLSR